MTASVGVSGFQRHLLGAGTLVAADLAMYDAKAAGRGRVSFHAAPDERGAFSVR